MRTSGKVLKDFENLRKALFDEEISHMAFMRDGKVEILYTQKYVDKLEEQLQQKENIIKEVREYIDKHCVNEKVSKEVGFKCYTMADTNELEHIIKLLDKENK